MTAWRQTGQGGNGTTCENPERPDVILKVNKPGLNTFEAVKKEFFARIDEARKSIAEGKGTSVSSKEELDSLLATL